MNDAVIDMELRKAIEKANRAKEIIESSVFKEAINKVNSYLDDRSLMCDPDNKEMAQRIIIAKQIGKSFEREFIKMIEEGEISKFKLAEIEKSRTIGQKVFRR